MAELRERLEHRPLLLQLLPGRHHQPHQRCHRVLGVRPQPAHTRFLPLAAAVAPARRGCGRACRHLSLDSLGRRGGSEVAAGRGGHGCGCTVQLQVRWIEGMTAFLPLFFLYLIMTSLRSLSGFCGLSCLSAPGPLPSSRLRDLWSPCPQGLDSPLTQPLPPLGGTCTRCLGAWGSPAPSAGPWLARWPWPGCWSTSPSGRAWSGRARYGARTKGFGATSRCHACVLALEMFSGLNFV